MVFVLVVLHINWHRRFVSVGIFLASALPWFFAWIFRNRMLTGMATSRGIKWEPMEKGNISLGINNFTDWLLHINSATTINTFPALLIVLLLISLTSWLLYFGIRYFAKPAKYSRPNPIFFFSVAFTLIYLSSLLVSISFFDNTTKFQHRILSSIYVTFTVILIFTFFRLWNHLQVTLKIVAGCVVVIALFLSGTNYYQTFVRLKEDGQGYAGSRYQNTVITYFLQSLPTDVKIYTNSPPAVYSSTERRSYILFLDAKLTDETKSFYDQLKREVRNGDAVLAFYGIRKGDINSESYDFLVDGLNLKIKHGTDMIYTNSP